MASYKLNYFNLRSKAAVIRTIFALADQKFEDYRIDRDGDEWPEFKETLPFKQVPVLEVTENSTTYTIAQSMAISRFLANRFGLAGKNELERANADMIIDHVMDILGAVRKIHGQPDGDEKQIKLQKFYNDNCHRMLLDIEKFLEKNESGYLVGDSATYADLYLINLYDWFSDSKGDVLNKLPLLKEHDQRIRSLDNLRDFLEHENANTKLAKILFI